MSLIHWWPLNGNTNNYGVNSLALINNGATINSNGKIGSCYYFDGNTSYLQATIEAGLFDGTGHPFSFTFWMKFTDELVDRKIIFGDYSLASPYFNIEMSYGSASYSGRIRFCWSNGCDYWFTVATGIKDTWQHYAITYDGINKISLYKDGTFIESATATLNAASSGTYYIGRDGRTGSTALKGYLNDFRIYNHALSAKEVKEISKGLMLHYNFEDACSNLIPVFSANPELGITIDNTTHPFNLGPIYKISQSGNTSKVYRGLSYAIPNLKAGDVISMGCWIYTEDKSSLDSRSELRVYQEHNDGSATNWNGINWLATHTDGKWCYYSRQYTLDSNLSSAIFNVNVVKNGTFWITGIKVEYGSTTTPFDGYKEAVNTIYDNSGYGNNGTVNGNIQLSSDSAAGKHSIYSPAGANYVERQNFPVGGFNADQQFTINAWIKIVGYVGSDWNTIFRLAATNARDQQLHFCYNASGNIILSQFSDDPQFTTNVALNTWTMVTWVHYKDGSTAKCKYFVNGQQIGNTQSYSGLLNIQNNARLTLFYDSIRNSYGANLLMGDFKIYATALSAEDILAEYNRKAAIDKNGNLSTGEIIETTYNLLTSENLFNGRVNTSATSNVGEIVTRNGYSAYRISPVAYWSGDGATSKNICKGQFGSGQYIFDLWIDVDDIYYDGNGRWVPGGFEVYYTDGSVDNIVIDANSTQGHSGYQHLIRKTNADKTISGLGVYYYIGVPVYIRCDSVICKVNSDEKICKSNIVASGQFVEPAVSDYKCKLTRYGVVSNAVKEL